MAKVKTSDIPDVPQRSKSGVIRARIDPALKGRAEAILDHLGINPSDAIRMFYAQIDLRRGLPFPVEIPNAATRKAIRDAEAGDLTRYDSADEMFKEMGI